MSQKKTLVLEVMMSVPTMHQMMQTVSELEVVVQARFESENNDDIALQKSQEIYGYGREIIEAAVLSKDTGETPLPLLLHLASIMSEDNIRCFDKLQCSLAKTCRLAAEVVLYKSLSEKRKTTNSHKEILVTSMDSVLQTLPAGEVEGRYHLQAALDAVKSLDAVNGFFKTYFLPVVISEGTEISGKVSSLEGGHVLKPMVALLAQCHKAYGKEHVGKGFRKCWDWSWFGLSAKNLAEVDQYTESQLMGKYRKNQDFALCSLEVVMQIINNPKTDEDEKKRLILSSDAGPNLFTFSSLRADHHRFREVRYLAVQYLIALANSEEYKAECIKHLGSRLAVEDRPMISDLLKSAYVASEDQDLWKEAVKEGKAKALEEAKKAKGRLDKLKERFKHENKGDGFHQESNDGYGPAPWDAKPEVENVENLDELQNELADEEAAVATLEANAAFIEKMLSDS